MANWKSSFGLSFFGVLILTSFAIAQGPAKGVTDSAITMGILCPLSGPRASAGGSFLEGLQTYVRHVNDIGGVHERAIVLQTRDDGGDPDLGVAAVDGMVSADGVFGIVSASEIQTTQALLERWVPAENIPLLAFGAPFKSLLSGSGSNVFVFGMPHGDQVILAIEYLLKRNPGLNPRLGLISQASVLGKEVDEGFHRASKRYGLEVVGEAHYGSDTSDFTPIVDGLRSAQVDHVVLGATSREALEIIREASEIGWFPWFFGTSSTADPEMMAQAGEGIDNYFVVDYLGKPWERSPGVTLMVGSTQKYYPKKNTSTLHRQHVLGYVGGLLIGEALRNAGRDLTRQAFIDTLRRIQNLNTHGLAGPIDYEAEFHLLGSQARIFRFDRMSQRFRPLTAWSRPVVRPWQ